MLIEMLIPYLTSLLIGQGEEWIFWGLGLWLVILLGWFIISILLCIWVYRDAERRGMNGALWLIIVLLTGLIGLIIYLVVRKDKATSATPPPPP